MTDDEAEKIYQEIKEYFGKDCPNPEQEPIRFAHYVKLYHFYKTRNVNEL